MSKSFSPIVGNLLDYRRYIRLGKFPYNFTYDLVKANPGSKFAMVMMGSYPKIIVHDLDMTEQIISLVGDKIDRQNSVFGKILFYWVDKSFIMSPISESNRQRRKDVFHHLGLSMLSKYIPMFVEECQMSLTKWRQSSELVEMAKATKEISFNIVARMMFGDDVNRKIGKIEMVNFKTGELKKIPFYEAVVQLMDDSIAANFNSLTIMFPLLIGYKIGKTNKILGRNSDSLYASLSKMVKNSEDEHSLY